MALGATEHQAPALRGIRSVPVHQVGPHLYNGLLTVVAPLAAAGAEGPPAGWTKHEGSCGGPSSLVQPLPFSPVSLQLLPAPQPWPRLSSKNTLQARAPRVMLGWRAVPSSCPCPFHEQMDALLG